MILAPMSTRQKILFSVLLVWLFHWFFLGDYLQYREVLSSQSVNEVQEYFEDYLMVGFGGGEFEEVKIVRKVGVARILFRTGRTVSLSVRWKRFGLPFGMRKLPSTMSLFR